MQQKELRLGVVLTGGVSLVVYMHGVSKELLKLARASRSYHDREDTDGDPPSTYTDSCAGREIDSERVYFDLLKTLGKRVDLRVVIDVIAGASAGGVNGIVLGRALAHDLGIDAHRKMWLAHADAISLLEHHAGRWGKLALRPLLGLALRRQLRAIAPERETRQKLMEFVRSRWFHPPFSGMRYSAWLLDAFDTMDLHAPADGSLLPRGHSLDLVVSVTDFHGHTNKIPLHMPDEISERDHRHLLTFGYARRPDGKMFSDFDRDNVPGLVFASRATSCFPGAFPPLRISEIDQLLLRQQRDWPTRGAFVSNQMGVGGADGRKAEDIVYIDGSVVENKPFGAAVRAIGSKPAYRAVTRRILYVEPSPVEDGGTEENDEPGFFRTILAALAEIPRNEPIHDDLEHIGALNRHARLVGAVMAHIQPRVDRFVDAILPVTNRPFGPSVTDIAAWRDAANQAAADEAGYAFESYFRLKVLRVSSRVQELAAKLESSAEHDNGAASSIPVGQHLPDLADRADAVAFLKAHDVEFRIRRIRFVIRRLNLLYQSVPADQALHDQTAWLDQLKTTLYGLLQDARDLWSPTVHEQAMKDQATDQRGRPTPDRIAAVMDLEGFDGRIDEVFSVMVLNAMPQSLRRELFTAYLGFSFFDVMSYPMMRPDGFEELEEILIDRISPADATAIRAGGAASMLRGTAMRKFAGFFNRSHRENDYLWGRLNAADRLVDIIIAACGEADPIPDQDVNDLKTRLFTAILDAEAPHLQSEPGLVETIRAEVRAGNDRAH